VAWHIPGANGREYHVVARRAADTHALVVLTGLMSESGDSRDVLELASASAPTLVPGCQVAGALVGGLWRLQSPDLTQDRKLRDDLEVQLRDIGDAGGLLRVPAWGWVYAYPLRHLDTHHGSLVVHADADPGADDRFLLEVLAQHAGFALGTTTLMSRERQTAYELARTNTALSRLVLELQRTVEIHRRLDDVVSAGGGHADLAGALHGLTGFAVALEDRFGNLLAWAPDPVPDPPLRFPLTLTGPGRREVRFTRKPQRIDGRIVALASGRHDVEVLISLIDPDERAGAAEMAALEHAATVLSLELASLASAAEAELRLGRDLVEDLLAGEDDDVVRRRALAFGYDLGRPRRVAVIDATPHVVDEDETFLIVRTLARRHQVATLVTRRAGHVVLLADGETDWESFRGTLEQGLPGGRCRLGVGTPCEAPSEYPRSYREGQLALRLADLGSTGVSCWEELGVFRYLSSLDDLDGLERFVCEQLGPLLRHDEERNARLVETLYHWLESGGSNAAAAQALAVHPSTIKYRVQKARDLGGFDLTRPETRFTLQFATKGWHLLQCLRSAPALRPHTVTIEPRRVLRRVAGPAVS
jgi:sugar diacid utilization regulator